MAFYNIVERRNYYGNQLKEGKDKDGKPLTKRQRAYRAGFLKASNNAIRAYKSKERRN